MRLSEDDEMVEAFLLDGLDESRGVKKLKRTF